MTSTFPVPFLSKPKFGSVEGPPTPCPSPSVQCKSSNDLLVEWQSKETVKHQTIS